MKLYIKSIAIIAGVLIADQALKMWVHDNMYIGQDIQLLGKYGMLHYTENNGMAFGIEWGGEAGKLALTLFRIIAVGIIGYGVHYLIKKRYHRGLVLNSALIFAGAMGNIIDSVFYGVLYGYAPLFHGRVIDMLYFPLLQGTFPKWMPLWGGEDFIFFRPVFNLADAAISVGVILIIIFQKHYFKEDVKEGTIINNEVLEE